MFNSNFANFLWSMFVIYMIFIVIMMFIRIFSDIFTRENLSGWGKAGWIFLLFVFPFIGILIYVIARPKNTDQDKRMMAEAQATQARLTGGSSVDDIAKAQDLLDKGSITQDEFNALKAKALA
jgi:uncharacterized membrane protein